ncbi:MAG: hypothetical protein AAF847_19965 [Bacteroidota bacterium]
MKKLLYLFALCFTTFYACNNLPDEAVQENDPVFHAAEPSRIYFQNTRSHHYQLITQQATKIDHYYLKTIAADQLFYPVIANNWLAEEAYMLFESKVLGKAPMEIKLSASETLKLDNANRKSQYEAAFRLAKVISSGESACVQTENGACLPIFASEQERTVFKTVMRDYLKLVERF